MSKRNIVKTCMHTGNICAIRKRTIPSRTAAVLCGHDIE